MTRKVEKPWGHELIFALTSHYCGKVLHIKAGCRLSLQYHQKKDETFMVQSGEMDLEVDETCANLSSKEDKIRTIRMKAGDVYHCLPLTEHRMSAVSDVVVIEVSTPELDDVIRVEDDYGREGTNKP